VVRCANRTSRRQRRRRAAAALHAAEEALWLSSFTEHRSASMTDLFGRAEVTAADLRPLLERW
jgi:hypothetical protein